jgi:hypothetical protein
MTQNRRQILPGARAWPLLALLVGLALAAGALRAGATADDAPSGDYVVVRHVLRLSEDGSYAYDEESRDTVSAAFVVNQHKWSGSSLPVPVAFNVENAPAGHDIPALIQGALGKWNAAGSNFAFSWAGDSTGNTGACSPGIDVDGVNTIRFEQLSGLTLGITCTVYPPGSNSTIVEFDMRLDSDTNWGSGAQPAPGKYDLPTTILHELGHAAAIGHSDDLDAVMYPQLLSGQGKRTLMPDDLSGIIQAYGAGTPTPTSTPTQTPTPTETVPTASATPPPVTTVPIFQRVRAPQLARD